MTSAGGMLPRDGFHAKKLYDDMLKKSTYKRVIRPVGNGSDSLPVRVGLRLTSIIDVVRTARFFLESLAFTYIHHEFISITQYNIISLINEQCDANGPVERRDNLSVVNLPDYYDL